MINALNMKNALVGSKLKIKGKHWESLGERIIILSWEQDQWLDRVRQLQIFSLDIVSRILKMTFFHERWQVHLQH